MGLVAWQYGRLLWPTVMALGVAAPVAALLVRFGLKQTDPPWEVADAPPAT